MADNESAVLMPVPATGDTTTIIDIINRNFYVLAARIKMLNQNFSYLDMMRIADIFTSNEDGATLLAEFMSTAWASLDNYAGVYIRLTKPNASFDIGSASPVVNGDYIVKMPGNQFLHIKGESPIVYVPKYDVATPFSITYIPSDEGSAYLDQIDIPTNVASNLRVRTQTGIAAHPNGQLLDDNNTPISSTTKLRDVRWYTSSGEEIVWSGSYNAISNETNISNLTATFIYQTN